MDERYERVSFDTIAQMSPETRVDELREVLLGASVRFPNKKSEALVENFDLVKTKYGDLKSLKTRFAQHEGVEEKIDFLEQFAQIGPKYARNIGMDLYLPDFRDYIAVDSRIKGIFKEAGYDYEGRTYEEQEAFLRSIANELDLEAWELDRIFYNYESEVTTKLSSGG